MTVKGNVQPEAVLQTVSKTGKATSFWEEAAPAPVSEAPAVAAPPAEAPAAEPESKKPTEAVAAA